MDHIGGHKGHKFKDLEALQVTDFDCYPVKLENKS